jgi:hypothetical protein
LRRKRDSNPRYPLEVHTLSRRASSTTRASLLFGAGGVVGFPNADAKVGKKWEWARCGAKIVKNMFGGVVLENLLGEGDGGEDVVGALLLEEVAFLDFGHAFGGGHVEVFHEGAAAEGAVEVFEFGEEVAGEVVGAFFVFGGAVLAFAVF